MPRKRQRPLLWSKNREKLHIVDGQATGKIAKRLYEAGENVVPWMDALYLGPVPDHLELAELSKLRERYWDPGRRGREYLSRRDRALARFREFKEVVLWFGSGSAAQLSLAQVLEWLSHQDRTGLRITLVPVGIVAAPDDQLALAFQRRARVTTAQYRLARSAWFAYRSPSPRRLERLLLRDFSALPDLRPVLVWTLQQYPSTKNGLSWLEQRLLEVVAGNPEANPATLLKRLGDEIRDRGWGDQVSKDALRRFILDWNQSIRFATPFTGDFDSAEFNGAHLVLTEFGAKVLVGDADYVAFNGIDRWIGGVHLLGRHVGWRWNPERLEIIDGD